MVVFSAFRRLLVALALCVASLAISSPAFARSHHGAYRHAHAHARHVVHHVRRHYALHGRRHVASRGYRHAIRTARVPHELAVARLRHFAYTHPHLAPDTAS